MNDKELSNWLLEINNDFIKNEIPPKNRPWNAILRYSREFKVYVTHGSEVAKKIFN